MRFKVYVSALVLAGSLVAVLPDFRVPERDVWYLILILAILAFVAESLAIQLPMAGSVSMSFGFVCAGLVFAGPVGGAMVALASSVTPDEIRQRKSPWLMLANVVQLQFSVLIAGSVFQQIGGVPVASDPADLLPLTNVIASLAAVVAFFVSNALIVTAGVALAWRVSVAAVWREQRIHSHLPSLFILALLGYLMAQLMVVADWLGILLLAIPLVVARETFQVYERLSDAYADTVRSLVRTLEAKDPYTRGHSERVSEYALALARKAGMPEPEVKMFRYAGLLHDIGKIGVLRDTLVKQGSLTAEEFDSIRRHPAVGADLLEPVEFLERVTPYIHAHHERMDGGGYPAGLAGDDIPWEARILSVADCFDAMTSNRAYRSAMSEEDACAELVRVSGTQLDGELVEHFLEVLAERAVADSERWASGEADG